MMFATLDPLLFVHGLLALLPVLVFLVILLFLDSFKLTRLQSVLLSIVAGASAAGLSLLINVELLQRSALSLALYSRYVAPVVEELVKAAYLIFLIRSHRVGFMVDSAIHGFAVGAGFALIENIYYLQSLSSATWVLWVVRGFGTAIMHGGTTAIFAIMAKGAAERHEAASWRPFLPALLVVVALHSFFNHFFLPPIYSTVLLLIVLPAIMVLVFVRSENSTRDWLELGFDTDQELLDLLQSDRISSTKIGAYLQTLKNSFPAEIVVDILCYLRLHLELSIKAKGLLLMREAGFKPAIDPETKSTFAELHSLEKNIGRTGMLAISPFLSTKSRDVWQQHLLAKS